MKSKHLHPIPLKSLILCADGQFTSFDPEHDHIWEMVLENTNYAPFYLQTTYRLQAVSMRLFINLFENNHQLLTEDQFTLAPHVTDYAPGFLRIKTIVRDTLIVKMDFFIPESEVVIGDFRIENQDNHPLDLQVVLAAVLVPMDKGIPTHPEKEGGHQIITGHSGKLFPVLFMGSGPTAISNPYPALSLSLNIPEGQNKQINWSLASKDSHTASFTKAQSIIKTNWKSNAKNQLMYHKSRLIKITSGNSDWDEAFTLAQTIALTHLLCSTENDQTCFFERSRLPDTQYNPDKINNLTILETMQLSQVLLPSNTDKLVDQLKGYFTRIDEKGMLRSKLNPSQFIRSYQEPPLLAQLYLNCYEISQDLDLLQSAFPQLCKVVESWLGTLDKQDQLFRPVWQNLEQLQLETGLFSFDDLSDEGRGMDLQKAISPALASMLLSELNALEKIAVILKDEAQQIWCKNLATSFKKTLELCWVESRQTFGYIDVESLLSPTQELFFTTNVQKEIWLGRTFSQPQRLVFHLFANDDKTRASIIRFVGKDSYGTPLVEEVKSSQIRWILRKAHVTSQNLFRELERITIDGLGQNDQFSIETIDLSQEDITCMLPIWSGGIQMDHYETLLESMLNPLIKDHDSGIPETWQSLNALPDSLPIYINILWNTLIIEGLVKMGAVEQAQILFSNMMATIIHGLKTYKGFFNLFEQETLRPSGERNNIAGLPPLRLFLELAGIKIFNPDRIAIWGCNPFPSPIQVDWQGLSIRREGTSTTITFPNGATFQGDPSEPTLVTSGVDTKR
jgi:hypothetical protein